MVRWGFGLFFAVVLIWAIIFAVNHKDEIFKNEVTIEYNTGCSEKYVDGILITPECPKPQTQHRGNEIWMPNLNLTPTKNLSER